MSGTLLEFRVNVSTEKHVAVQVLTPDGWMRVTPWVVVNPGTAHVVFNGSRAIEWDFHRLVCKQ